MSGDHRGRPPPIRRSVVAPVPHGVLAGTLSGAPSYGATLGDGASSASIAPRTERRPTRQGRVLLLDVSEQQQGDAVSASTPLAIDDLARLENAAPVHDADELAAEIWDSDEELDDFLVDLRASRRSSLT